MNITALGDAMPTIKTRGGELYFESKGKGEPIVILKGLAHTVSHWLGYDRTLAKHFKVIAIDHRGIGRSKAYLPWHYSIFDMAKDVKTVCDHLGVKKPHILGLSLGGMVALAHGSLFPGRTQSLIVANSSIAGLNNMRLTPHALIQLAKSAPRPKKINLTLSDLLFDTTYPTSKRLKLVEQWTKIDREQGMPFGTVAKHLIAASRFNATKQLQKLRVPTLILYGAGDQFVPVINSMKLHFLIPKAQLIKIDKAGHELMTDKPKETLNAIVNFTAAT